MLIHLPSQTAVQAAIRTAIRAPRHGAVRGMTLVEILVALVVISVGLLGVAALQLVSLRNSQGSYLRSQATALADDIIDRMRANRTVALAPSHDYDIGFGETITLDADSTRADHDRAEWKSSLLADLPKTQDGDDADGKIAVVGTIVTVTIRWGERATNDTDTNDPIEFVTRTEI
jgi:type IV pilus assembly protein PilV